VCLSADRNDHNDYGKRFLAAAMWVWHLLPHHDNDHWNINDPQSMSGPMPISLEHGELDVAIDRQFVWIMWLYRSTDGNGSE
jgi:hypothetical protein